jgi:antitoxin YefM
MIALATDYTSYTQARDNFVKVLEQVEEGDSVVVIQRRGHPDVAMISADELSALLEEVYLLRSPANARRLYESLEWSQQSLDSSSMPMDIHQFAQQRY